MFSFQYLRDLIKQNCLNWHLIVWSTLFMLLLSNSRFFENNIILWTLYYFYYVLRYDTCILSCTTYIKLQCPCAKCFQCQYCHRSQGFSPKIHWWIMFLLLILCLCCALEFASITAYSFKTPDILHTLVPFAMCMLHALKLFLKSD